MYLKTDSQSPGINRSSWRPRGAIWGAWLTVRPGCFNPGKETRYQMYRRLGGPPTDRNSIAVFEVRILHILPLNESYRLRYAGRHYHCTACNHVLLTKLKNFCTSWCWFNLDVFFMDSCFSRIKWETLTYLERCEGNFLFQKINDLSIIRCSSRV